MPLLADRVLESSITAGTGTLTLAGALTGYRTFNSAFSNGNVVYYTIDDGLGNWEVGYGTVGTGTLTRSTVLESSNANALVVFTSVSKRVFCTAPVPALLPDQTGNSTKILSTDGSNPSWIANTVGTVTAVSVVSANGFAGTSSGGATPALTISTSVTGVLKGNGTTISAATSGTDYSAGTSSLATGILKSTTTSGALSIAVAADFPTLNQNTTGTASNITAYTVNQNVGTANTVQHSDITTARAASLTTGYVYYGNTGTKYAGFDGTNFVTSMPMSFSILGSSASCTGNAATVTTVTATNLAGAVAPSTTGNVLTSNGTTWVSSPPAASGISAGKAIALSLVFG